ncbi:MAG: helix-turn-helix transcriptional regulator [Candidatus Omnitrophica bacterium]|nr:helix-turn-helix transcriptional regulator [Candidatus Omnitrophota bacterium]
MYIGNKLKELRKSKGLTLVQLSHKSGVQVATLSRMENLKMTGTVDSHMAIARALGVDVTQLYADIIKEERAVDVNDQKTPRDVFVHSKKASYEILTGNVLQKKMMPTLLTLETGGGTSPEQSPFGTEKFVYVLDGKIMVRVGEEEYPLVRGNSIYFEASFVHTITNNGNKTGKALVVSTPAAL